MSVRLISKIVLVIVLLGLALSAVAGCSADAESRDFRITRYEQVVLLQSDGGAVVTETVQYKMLARRSDFLFEIKPAPDGSVSLLQVDIAARSDSANRDKDKFIIVSQGKSSSNGSGAPYYLSDQNNDRLRIQVMALSEAGQDRTIRLTYKLDNAVVLGSDTAYLIRTFFTNHADADIDEAVLNLKMPAAVPDIRLWTLPVSTADFTVSRPSDDQLVFVSQHLPGETNGMVLYSLMPEDDFPGAQISVSQRSWNDLTAEARQADIRLDAAVWARSATHGLIFALLVVSILLVLLIYWIFDRESAATFRLRYWQGQPNCPPAILAVLMRKAWPGRMILSTLLDLVRRKELTLNGNIFALTENKPVESSEMAAFEIFLIQWLFNHIADDTVVSTAEIRRFSRDHARSGEMATFYKQFRLLVDEEMERRGLLDDRIIRRGRRVAGVSAAIYFIMTFVSVAYLQDAVGLLLIIPAVGLIYYASILRRLTTVGRDLYAVGQAVRRTILDVNSGKVDADQGFYTRILPAAVAMAVSDSLIDRLAHVSQSAEDPFADYNLEIYGIAVSSRPWQDQLRVLKDDLHVMESMLSASLLMSTGLYH